MGLSNTYFEFKQFTIHQQHCAQKVSTDACILGAWATVATSTKTVLDLGTGTGLLALMMAQKSEQVAIHAIDIDPQAVTQARANMAASPWAARIQVFAGDIRSYVFPDAYDLIVTNPPFFNNSLLGPDAAKNQARHTLSLSYTHLLESFEKWLLSGGEAAILLPYNEYLEFKILAERRGFYTHSALLIQHTPNSAVKRVAFMLSRKLVLTVNETKLNIKNSDGCYSAAFIQILQPYYLHL